MMGNILKSSPEPAEARCKSRVSAQLCKNCNPYRRIFSSQPGWHQNPRNKIAQTGRPAVRELRAHAPARNPRVFPAQGPHMGPLNPGSKTLAEMAPKTRSKTRPAAETPKVGFARPAGFP